MKKEYTHHQHFSMYGLVGNTAIDTVAYHASKGGGKLIIVPLPLSWQNTILLAMHLPGYFATELTVDTLNTPEFTAYMKATVPMEDTETKVAQRSVLFFLQAMKLLM